MQDYKCDARKHALEMQPKESCGVVAGNKYWRCRNIAENPEEAFALNPNDYLAARAYGGQIQAIIHSHPKGGKASIPDQKACTRMKIPWYIYLIPEDQWLTINPC